ncbi:hypothetical protein DFJ43DRAFT_250566 [Lentinula guzmanii]|uniref:Uncharacterized protein n=1 Tax=Lentinula guzmanii TaxID=2804957 RepID=A0AA38JJV2_9AGAR|nr:hypothetical protein DFJ43DRAFT_250566 [Lentinula guzmanii]
MPFSSLSLSLSLSLTIAYLVTHRHLIINININVNIFFPCSDTPSHFVFHLLLVILICLISLDSVFLFFFLPLVFSSFFLLSVFNIHTTLNAYVYMIYSTCYI